MRQVGTAITLAAVCLQVFVLRGRPCVWHECKIISMRGDFIWVAQSVGINDYDWLSVRFLTHAPSQDAASH